MKNKLTKTKTKKQKTFEIFEISAISQTGPAGAKIYGPAGDINTCFNTVVSKFRKRQLQKNTGTFWKGGPCTKKYDAAKNLNTCFATG